VLCRVLRSALRAGGLSGFLLARSGRSVSGVVLRVAFVRFAPAAAFARLWSARLGVSAVVRPGAGLGPGVWVVSLPVVVGPGLPSAVWGLWVPVVGGLRGFLRALGRFGLAWG
jgi:hypothetical protein